MGRKPKKKLGRNDRTRTYFKKRMSALRTGGMLYLKKLRELRLRDEALQQEERRKQLENWSQEDFD